MRQWRFTVPMKPVPKERARTITKGSSTWSYTPDRTLFAERVIHDAVEGKGAWFPQHVGVKLTAVFYRIQPDNPTLRDIERACHADAKPVLPVIAPDVDNYSKILQDAMNTMTYTDDCQITDLHVKKRFGDPARIEFVLEEDDGT